MLAKLRSEEAAWVDVRERFACWLRDNGAAEHVVGRQLAAVRTKFKPRLYGLDDEEEERAARDE